MIKGRKHMKKAEFRKVRALLDAKVPVKTVAEVMNRSYVTILRMKDSKTLKSYRQAMREEREKKNGIKTNKPEPEKQSTSTPLLSEMKKQTALLMAMAKDFSFLAKAQRSLKIN